MPAAVTVLTDEARVRFQPPPDASVATPYLAMDLELVARRYNELTEALPGVRLHYAVKCNPDPAVVQRIFEQGGSFEIASYQELRMLVGLGVAPDAVLFSNPVKSPHEIEQAHAAGLRRFSFDSSDELIKLARHAPGAQVYVRIVSSPRDSVIHSEGKFGVDANTALELLLAAREQGLEPYGIAFHVGSQMLDPSAWVAPMQTCGWLMEQLGRYGIRLQMVDVGGGFPAHYHESVPTYAAYGAVITEAGQQLPYAVQLVAEPGRALVADAGVMVARVIGVAQRGGAQWLHLDVGAFNGMMEALESNNTLHFPMSDERHSRDRSRYHVTGPTCDSQDTICYGVELSAGLQTGDLVFIHTSGGYTTSYASNFNGFAIPITVYAD